MLPSHGSKGRCTLEEIMLLSPQDLVVLVTVIKNGSIRSAAEALHKTQPALSQAIHRLEEALGFELLDRNNYRAKPTPEAIAFAELAKPVLEQHRQLNEFSHLIASGVEPRFKLLVDNAIPIEVWRPLLSQAAKTFPQSTFEVQTLEGYSVIHNLRKCQPALAICFDITVDQRSQQFEHLPMGQKEFITVMRSDLYDTCHDDPTRETQIIINDFSERNHVFDKVEGRQIIFVSCHQTQLELILVGVGWGTVPVDFVSQYVSSGVLASFDRKSTARQPKQPYSLYRPKKNANTKVSQFIWELVKFNKA